MGNIIKSTEEVVSCSDNGQHPLVYINLKPGFGQCQYCGQRFEKTTAETAQTEQTTAA
ncbi:MAG: zinc-finger domain-containing protein [Mariprofundus sp.]|nr:zinc-finger domain-containing protein [Mariprofundus sp.]